jgi:purine-nucleoside phosphorylase
MCSGPNYETPAEIRAFRTLGADAVGMSTVPEALVAGHCGMAVVGISCITNMAAGVSDQKLSHQEVVETAAKVHDQFQSLIDLILQTL